jgi:diaminopimelate epimerase
MRIPFTKAHGAGNDFLLTWLNQAPRENRAEAAIAICERHTGIGADGWLLVDQSPSREKEFHGAIQLFNSDGSVAELSGNGTRCAAAFLVDAGLAAGEVRIRTGAGVKSLRLLQRSGTSFVFEMNMGRPQFPEGDRTTLDLFDGPLDATLVDVGNPQCVVQVNDFEFDWRSRGAEIERHPRFPNRTNVSFVRRVDEHTIDVRFFERGAGETMSSGTGSTGAAAAGLRLGLVKSPVTIRTPAGPLELRSEDQIYLVGPAQIIGGGDFYLESRRLGLGGDSETSA